MRWALVPRGDGAAVALANRHYSRRRRASQVGPPGSPVVLRTPEGDAFWVTSRSDFERTDGYPWAWVNNYFRSESNHLASALIREAVAATLHVYGPPPADGMVTYVDPAQVRSANPGYCFLCAGCTRAGRTAGGHGRPSLLRFHLAPDAMPVPAAPLSLTPELVAA
jgi:hypothetical protein